MMQFTRSLTREVEIGGERLAVTLSKQELSVRPVGGRRPPFKMSWEAWVCACVAGVRGQPPTAEQIEEALKAIRAGAPKEGEEAEKATAAAPAVPETSARPSTTSGHDLTHLLGRLDHWLAAHRTRFHHGLQASASAADCDALAAALGKQLPEELRTWLSWHNGQNADVPGAFEQNWNLMSAQEIADAKKELDAQPHDGWKPDWLPFLDDDNGDYLCLDLGSPGCPVRECWRGRTDHPTVAPTLADWLSHFVSGLESGAYVEDPERGVLVRRDKG